MVLTLFVSNYIFKIIIVGNYSVMDAKRLNATVIATIGSSPLPPSQEPVRRTVILNNGIQYIFRQHSQFFNADEVNSAIENVYIFGEEVGPSADNTDLRSEAMLHLISHLLSEPCFDQLRTKEQLGYIVSVSHTKISQLLALRVIVQSNHKDPEHLDDRIERFLVQYRETIVSMVSTEFQANVDAVREHLLEKPKNLNQVMLSYYSHDLASPCTGISQFLGGNQYFDLFFPKKTQLGRAFRQSYSRGDT